MWESPVLMCMDFTEAILKKTHEASQTLQIKQTNKHSYQ